MSDIQHGDVLVSMPEGCELPEKAGKMEADEIKRLTKAPEDGRKLPAEVGELIRRAPSGFVQHPEITPEMLEQAVAKGAMFRQRQDDLELLANRFGQASMLAEGESWDLLLRMYGWIKDLGKRNALVRKHFHVLYDQFARK